MTSIVFSGSGVLFPGHLGAAEFLVSSGFISDRCTPVTYIGTSGGAIVASLLATGYKPIEALKIAESILPKDIIRLNWKFWQPADCIGLFSLSKLEKTLDKYIPKKFEELNHKLVIVAVDINTKKPLYFGLPGFDNPSPARAVVASASVPLLFTPVKYEKFLMCDGGLIDNFAVEIPRSADITYGVRINSTLGKKRTIASRTDYICSIVESALYETEEGADRIVHLSMPYHPFDLFRIKKGDITKMFWLGYKQAREQVNLW